MVFNDGISVGVASTAALCATSATLLAAFAFKNSLLKKIGVKAEAEAKAPKRWMRVGTVSQLLIYPIKGCAGIHVKQAKVTQLGLSLKDGEFLRDRVFMIVDENGTYQVQMKHPRLALISIQAGDDGTITLKAPDMEPLTFKGPTNGYKGPEKLCRIFQERGLKAVDCGDEAAKWLQTYMKLPEMRLVYHHLNETQRTISGIQTHFSSVEKSDLAAFQNYTSYLLIAEESVEELNRHLEHKVTYRNFRPSVLVSNTPEPFSEIRWGAVRIGNVYFRASKPCERCKIVTVDPDTGIHDKDGEPLKTLTKLPMDFGDEVAEKVLKNRGIMGLQMGLLKTPADEDAMISVGDPVYVALL